MWINRRHICPAPPSLIQPNPNGIDPRCEPKFYIETMEPYDGGWCRPQNDGPALRLDPSIQGDTTVSSHNPVDIKTKVVF